MRRRIEGRVESVTADRPGAQEVLVRVPAHRAASGMERCEALHPALNFVALTGRIGVGDKVVLNTVAKELRLGTGGVDFVVAVPEGLDTETPAPGHILKLRYTPVQTPVLAVEAPESPYHEEIQRFTSLDETPVVCAELHSQVPAVCAAARWALREHGWPREPRIVYVMTDGAALPLALSKLVPQMKERGLIQATVTAGQAFGGDLEAVNTYSALAAARTVGCADIIVVCQGPGNVGTDTPLGFSGVDQGLAVNAAASLGGVPIVVARISFADARNRHYGLSHHTVTVLKQIARAAAYVPIPRLPESQRMVIDAALERADIGAIHEPVTVTADRAFDALVESGIALTTMGRPISEERPFFLSACAAGVLAGQLLEARR